MAEESDEGRWMRVSASLFAQVEHVAYVALGILLSATALLALAGGALLLVQGLGDWTDTRTIFLIIDRLLFVLMLIEILHTVRASLKTGTLTCEPFLVVGLIASIRRVLVITLKSSEAAKETTLSDAADKMFRESMVELGVLGMLILVMVVSIYLLHRAQAKAVPGSKPAGQSE